jgi:SAM-dependent methyltransferase
MAIEGVYLRLLTQAIARRREASPSIRGLFLAYPDLLVPKAALAEIVGAELLSRVPTRGDAEAIWAYHGLQGVGDPLFDSLALLRELGVEPTVIDVAKLRGDERIVDLNHPLPEDLARRFDLVVDTGTCEHCFNVGQAFANACEALAAGGILVHAAPLTRINHGFWNFNPTIYPDFFEDNGFRMHVLTGVEGTLRQGFRSFPLDPFSPAPLPRDSVIYVVAERIEVRPLRWPVQRKYRGMIP